MKIKMKRDLLIPTSGSSARLDPLLTCISQQNILPNHIHFLLHWRPTKKELSQVEELIALKNIGTEVTLTHYNNSDYQPWMWIGYDRNFLVHQAQHKYIFMVDDDNIFEDNFFERTIIEYSMLLKSDKEILRSPHITWRMTSVIQSAWITWFSWLLPRFNFAKVWSNKEIKIIWANSLFWSTNLFHKIWFDDLYISCLEDVDFSYRVRLSWAQIKVSDSISIQHMERDKSLLEKKFLWSPQIAYERSKNRILFARKNASKREEIKYFWCGLRLQTIRFLVISLMWWWQQRRWIIKNILKWTRDWLFLK